MQQDTLARGAEAPSSEHRLAPLTRTQALGHAIHIEIDDLVFAQITADEVLIIRPQPLPISKAAVRLSSADAMGNKDIVGIVAVTVRARKSGRNCCSTSSAEAWRSAPNWPSATAPWDFWGALREVYGETREQRCWVHKTGNILNQMPKSLRAKAKGHLQDIWMADGLRLLRQSLWDQIPQGRRTPDQGPRASAHLLRLPGRALEAHSHDKPHRKHRRHGALENRQDQGLPEPQDRTRHGLQTDLERKAKMAESGWIKLTRRSHRRSTVQGRDQAKQTRRLKHPSPTL